MLNYILIGLVAAGAVIMLISIFSLLQTLRAFSGDTYQKKSTHYPTYACLVMMAAFFLGYVAFSIFLFLTKAKEPIMLLISLIFFFGAIFVCCMVTMQQNFSNSISARSLETIYSLISAVEAKDLYTKGHSEHVKSIVCVFYTHLPSAYKRVVNLHKLSDAAMLHDIGKIGIPDAILNKPGVLTPEEYEIIKQHAERGYKILKDTIYKEIGSWILYHHELSVQLCTGAFPENDDAIFKRMFTAIYSVCEQCGKSICDCKNFRFQRNFITGKMIITVAVNTLVMIQNP